MEVIQYLLSKECKYEHNMMDSASSSGHLPIVQWLHENRTEGCTKWAMNNAVANII